ncbi:MAG: hypothetical protein WBB01_24360 [Phormidesmis sp.]
MPPSPQSENSDSSASTPPEPGNRRALPWFWLGIFVGTVFGAAGLSLAAWAWIFIHEELSPVISSTLTDTLERPIELGDVEKVTFGSLQVGPSTMGASAADPTTVTADTVIVKFDLLEALFTSKLGLDLTLVEAEGYLAQGEEKGWLNFKLPEFEEDPSRRFKVRLDDIRIRDSQLTLVPLPAKSGQLKPIPLEQVSGTVSFDQLTIEGEAARRTRFTIAGEPVRGGEITLKGEVQPVVVISPIQAVPNSQDDQDDRNIRFATNLIVQGSDAPLSDVLTFTLSTIGRATDDITVESGQVSGTVDIDIRPQQPVAYKGALSVDDADIITTLAPLPLTDLAGQTRFQGNQWTVDRLSGNYGEIDAVAEGLIDFSEGYDLTVAADDVSVEEFTNTLNLSLPVPVEGRFDAIAQVGGGISQPEVAGEAIAITPLDVDKLTFTSAATDFFLQGRQLLLDDIAAVPSTGGSLSGSGQVRLGQGSPFTFQIAGRSLPARELAKIYGVETPFPLGLVTADATVTSSGRGVNTTVRVNAPTAQYPLSGIVAISGDTVTFRDAQAQVGGGTVSGSGRLVNGQWISDVTLANVQLNTFSETLRGDVSGQLQLSGNTDDTRLAAIAATGNLAFSQGLAAFSPRFNRLNAPLTAQVAWRGDRIEIAQATTDRITASGTLTPDLTDGFSGIEQFNLAVSARNYALAELPFDLPEVFALEGLASFDGTVTGRPSAPNVSGNLQLANLAVNRVSFDPLLAGTVAYAPSNGIALNVAGGTDRITINASPRAAGSLAGIPAAFSDLNFAVAWRDTFARGQSQGDLLNIQAGNFPLSVLNFPTSGAANIGQLRGTLTTADLAVNLANQTLEGDVVIDQLGLGYIGAGQLAGQVRYADNLATLTGGELLLDGNLYSLNGRLGLGGQMPVYSASIETQQGDVQNLLTALSIYRLEDFRRGLTPPEWLDEPFTQTALDTLLATSSTGNPTATLLNQLRRLAEIQALQAEAAIADAAQPLPPLEDLSGPFAGSFQLEGRGSDFALDFDLVGDDWQWGPDYSAQDVIARGRLTPGVLTLEPVRFASTILDPVRLPGSGEAGRVDAVEGGAQSVIAAVNLAGQLVFGRGSELTSNLQATAENLNVENLGDILQLPLDIEGLANARATLGGTLANPQLRGSAQLAAVTINDTPIESADAQFLYQNARLSLASSLVATAPEHPLTLSAQIPYAFEFMDVRPESDAISVNIDVQDEGLALLNIFNRQVAWESGSGQVNLTVTGTLENPQIAGLATIEDAVINARILPEPLTNVTGRAIFERERIIVEGVQGSFSDGQLIAAGTLPLQNPILTGPQISALTDDTPDIGAALEPTQNRPAQNPDNPLFPQPLAANRPLTVNLENIALDLEGLYSGGVNGQIIVGGSILRSGPQIGGEVVLSNGRVLLPEGSNANEAAATLVNDPDTAAFDIANTNGIGSIGTRDGITSNFRDLRLTLGDSVRIIQGNLLNFVADGTLVLNGPPSDLEPNGIINLRSGRVSLYTTLFRLRGRDNTAEFTPEMGLRNPFLDVSLRASVPEVNTPGPITSTPFATAEIADTSNNGFDNPGSLRTIRVRADVNGPANAIFENLELSSSPARDQAELIGLIGGGFVTALESTVGSLSGNGDSFGGLLNLVSGTLLTSVQDFVSNTLSLSEFRLFPVTAASRSRSEENSANGIDIGAAIGLDVSESTSLSLTKVLTDNTNPEFGVNYRLTDALTIRGATNFEDINQVLLEYEVRF